MAAIRLALMALLCLGAWAQDPAARPYWRTIVQGTHGMVAAEHPLEALAALDDAEITVVAAYPPVTAWTASLILANA